MTTEGALVRGNDLSAFAGQAIDPNSPFLPFIYPFLGLNPSQQIYVGAHVKDSVFVNNGYGPVEYQDGYPALAGMVMRGQANTIANENGNGHYPGWEAGGLGLIFLGSSAVDNTVTALKNGGAPYGFDLCDQVLEDVPGSNHVPGLERCMHKPAVIAQVKQKLAQHDAWKAQIKPPTGPMTE